MNLRDLLFITDDIKLKLLKYAFHGRMLIVNPTKSNKPIRLHQTI